MKHKPGGQRVPCWAAVSAAMLAAWKPPAEGKRIIIFGDNDLNYAGQWRARRSAAP